MSLKNVIMKFKVAIKTVFILLTLVFLLKHNFTFIFTPERTMYLRKNAVNLLFIGNGRRHILEKMPRGFMSLWITARILFAYSTISAQTHKYVSQECLELFSIYWMNHIPICKQHLFFHWAHLLWINLCKSFLTFFNCKLMAHNSGGFRIGIIQNSLELYTQLKFH